MDIVKIGKFLQNLRNEKGLTQEQLAEMVGVARRTVSRWETGTNMPDLDILIELSDFYAIDLREILNAERKSERMNEETKDTVLQVVEYSNEEKKRSAKIVTLYLSFGIIALLINAVMNLMEFDDTFWVGFLQGITFGLALGAMIISLLYATGLLEKLRTFKKRLLTWNNTK